MAKKDKFQNEVSIIWDFITCALLYAAICYFNGPDKQHELPQDQVRKFALIVSVAWFFISIIILRTQGTRVVLFRHKKKTPADAGKGAVKAAAAAKAEGKPGKKGGKAEEAPKPSEPETFILKDPATGAERLYVKDADGQWVSEDGQSVLKMDSVDNWRDQRQSDRSWQNDANGQISSGESAMDKTLKVMDEETARQNAALDKELEETLKRIEKYGTADDDPEHIKEIISRDQRLAQIESDRQMRKAAAADVGYKTASATKYAADKAFDVIGNTGGTAGKIGKAVYTGLTDQAGAISEAVAEGGDVWTASKKAGLDTLVSVAEDNLSGGVKAVGNIAGESVREMGKAMIDGKEGASVLMSGMEGGAKGLFKSSAEVVGENLGGFVSEGGSEMFTDAASNVTEVFVDNKDMVSTMVQDASNAAYDSFAGSVETMKKH